MVVLDLGCGVGDVSFLASELVGPSGAVVGIDRSDDAVAFTRHRAPALGYRNVEFQRGAVEDFVASRLFDRAIGRYVLMYQADPAAFIRAAASQVRPGGAVAFHEIAIYESIALPCRSGCGSRRSIGRSRRSHRRSIIPLPACACGAISTMQGLGSAVVFAEMPIDGRRESLAYAWLASSVRSLLLQIEKMGIVTATEIDIDTLEDRLRDAALEVHGQVLAPPQFCGWARI